MSLADVDPADAEPSPHAEVPGLAAETETASDGAASASQDAPPTTEEVPVEAPAEIPIDDAESLPADGEEGEAVEEEEEMLPDPEQEAPPSRPATPIDLQTWMLDCIRKRMVLPGVLPDMITSESHYTLVEPFFTQPDARLLVFQLNGDKLIATTSIPSGAAAAQQPIMYFVRTSTEPVMYRDDFDTRVQSGAVLGDYLQSLARRMTDVYSPLLAHGGSWPDSVRNEFASGINRFMSVLTDTALKGQGQTVLYVPAERLDGDTALLAANHDLMQRLEATVIHWTRQIKGVLSSNQLDSSLDNALPLEEVRFWQKRCQDLSGIGEQLEKAGVQRIIELLQATQSSYLQQFNMQVRLIKDGILRAESNHKFLSVLKAPCEGLVGAHLRTLPSLLPQIVDLIRLIWLHSPFYNDTLSITSLFQKVSSAVILRCQDCISLPDIFSGNTHDSNVALTNAIACCKAYQQAYTARVKAHGSCSDLPWDVNHNSVFAEIDSFTQLCSDLLEVVESRGQFAPRMTESTAVVPFAGTKGADLQRSIRSVEAQFVEALKTLATVAKDGGFNEITPTLWAAAFGRFKQALRDAEVRMQNIIATAFETVNRVEAGVEVVETFQALASRELVRRTLKKHTRWLFDLFCQQIDGVKSKFAAERSNPSLGPGIPRQAGSAIWATLLRDQLERPYRVLSQADFLPQDERAQEVLHSYSLLSGSFKEYVTKTYNVWVNTLGHDLIAKLSQPLMKRGPDRSTLLLNFDHTLMVVFAEIHHWQKLGFDVPSLAAEVYHKKEAMRTLRGHVMLVVRDYNAIIERLSPEERLLFRERIRFLDKKVQPGLAKLQWASPGIQEYYVADARKHSYKLKEVVDKYMDANERIAKLCQAIAQVSMININYKDLTSHIAFAEQQEEAVAVAVKMLTRLHHEVVRVMQKTYDVFRSDGLDVQQHWLKYTIKIDKMIEAALKTAVKNAMQDISRAVNGTGKSAPSPLFRVNVVLEGDTVMFQPSYPHLGEVIMTIADKVTDSLRELQRLPSILARGGKAQLPFADVITSEEDVAKVVRSIRRGLRDNWPNMLAYQTTWQEKYSTMWLTNKQEFLLQYEQSNPPLSKFDADVGRYGEVANNVQKEDTLMALNFCMLDCTMLKYSLVEHCSLWQQMFTQLLHDMTCKELASLRTHMAERGRALLQVPQSLDDMVASLNLMNTTNEEMRATEGRFEPLNQQFAILERYEVEVAEHVREELLTMPQLWTDFEKCVNDSSSLLDGAKKKFRAELLQSMDNLAQQVADTRSDWLENGPFAAAASPPEALVQLAVYRGRIKEILDTRASLEGGLEVFEIHQEPFQAIKDTEKDLAFMETLWGLANEWDDKADAWRETIFGDIATDEMEMQAQTQLKKVVKVGREVKDKDWEMVTFYRTKIETFKKLMPLIQDLKNPALRPRHWETLQQQVGKTWDPHGAEFTLGKMVDLGLEQFVDEVGEISGAASKELSIEESIAEISRIWDEVVLDVVPFKEAGHHILRAGEELFQTLEDNQVTLSTMKASRFVKAFLADVDLWERTLSLILEVVEMTGTVQRQWMYLENIFQGEDIRKQLPSESAKFDDVNSSWMDIMTTMRKKPKAKLATHVPGLLSRLTTMNEVLEEVQKSLDEYLETKRQCFPRFYFVSNDDLLEVLGQSRNPENVQPHLLKCFDAIKRMELALSTGKRAKECIGIHSDDGEYVPYTRPAILDGPVEGWLCLVEDEMKRSLATLLAQSLAAHKKTKDKEAWIKEWPGQLVLTVSQMIWTAECVKAMSDKVKGSKMGLKSLKKKQVHLLSKLTDMVRTVKNKTQRKKIVALITVEVHSRDVIDKLAKVNEIDDTAFEWLMQLRFYWERDQGPNGDCVIRQTNTRFTYGYEYIANSGRLVITPLTDRCYMTLTTALHLKRGGSPKGPAGTGKTETVKDLGKAMGDYVIVVNCSEGLDYKSLGRMFSGLAQTGAWGCFDEFNRINIEVLSVVAQQILSILSAQIPLSPDNVETRFVFEGCDIRLKWSCGVFITMNPGYAGRTELPDNLKSMFRPISMMVPDTGLIAEIILFGQGFDNTRVLAKKADTMYVLARQQLSKQDHYDFGLRSMVSTLLYAGRKRQEMPTVPQEEIVLLAMKDMNIAKMTGNDLPLFKGIMADLFPGVDLTPIDYGPFRVAIEAQLREQGFQVSDWMCQKVIELFETKNSRHSVMIVGLSGSGKSVAWRTLKRAMTACHKQGHQGYQAAKEFCINPKALSLAELYGEFDFTTNEWADGVLSSVMRDVCADEKADQKWILFDAPVDTLWIESMNSTMDDNKILTLINGERISMPQQVSLLFEVEDLAVASPATVSRCGMVYHDTIDLGWRPYVASWLERQKDERQRATLRRLFDKHVDRLTDFVEDQCVELVKQQSLTRVMSLCKLLETLLATSGPSTSEDTYERMLEQWFLFSCIWSILAGVDEEGRKKADSFMREKEGQFPGKDTIFEYFVDSKNKNWGHWEQELKANWRYAPGTPFHKIQVPTVDTVRYGYLAQRLVENNKPFLITGPVGTGKTSVVTDVLRRLDPEVYSQLIINMSSKTSSNNVQEIIEGRVEKRTKGVFVPSGGKQMVTFLDDLNMPAKDEFGSQPPLELLRLWQEYGFWYDRKKQTTLSIREMRLCAAMGPPGGGRMVISRRLQSRFNLINMTFPANSQIRRIFGTMIHQHLLEFDEGCKPVADMVTTATLDAYNFISARMLPTPAKIHYLFNLRDISKVFQGLLRAHKDFHDTKDQLARLWVHECVRVFRDRLVGDKDTETFNGLIREKLTEVFDLSYDTLCEDGAPFFADFLREGTAPVYEDADDKKIRDVLQEKLEDYNNSGFVPMDLVLFRDAVDHVCRIVRVLRVERGNMLLIGVGGSGRQSLARLASFVLEYKVFQIEVTKHYRNNEFREDLMNLYKLAGVENKPTSFLFVDTQIVLEDFLEDINNILSSGEVPNLFDKDSLEEVFGELGPIAKRQGVEETPAELYRFFIDRVRNNLHVVLCMSPVGEAFRNRMRMYPGLVNCTTIDYFAAWPQDALLAVANKYLDEVSFAPEPEASNTLRMSVCKSFAVIQQSVIQHSAKMLEEMNRHNYVTPTNYLELVTGYRELLKEKRDELTDATSKYDNGLEKLDDTRHKVEVMGVELEAQTVKVAEFQRECDEYLVVIVQQKREADDQQKAVSIRSEKIAIDAKQTAAIAADAQADLDEALPALEAAVTALNSLNKGDITEIKSYTKPPPLVELVLAAVMTLRRQPTGWAEAKKAMGDSGFIKQLIDFDKDHMPERVLKGIAGYLKNPEFVPEVVGKVSNAAKSLCMWVRAMDVYGRVFKQVEPKRKALEAAQTTLAAKEASLRDAQAKLQEVTDKVNKLQADYEEKLAKKEELRVQAETTATKLDRAGKLVSGLAGEKTRWEASSKALKVQMSFLVGDCLLASGFMSYLGPFISEYRDAMVNMEWKPNVKEENIPCDPNFSMASFLAKPTDVRFWNIQGLPSDNFSTENGVIVTRGRRWPLMVDPQGQAIKWIKNMERERGLKVVDLQQADYLRTLENAIQFGTPVLMQNVAEELDPSLAPILNKAFVKVGGRLLLKLGDKEIEYSPDFRFYITTKMSNPHYTPEISTKATIVNFAVVEQGLESQLLGIVVSRERPDLEEQKNELVVKIAAGKKRLVDLEDKILHLLSTAKGSLLDDTVLVETLNSSKVTSVEVTEQLAVAETTEVEIDEARELYRPSAKRSSILFFVLNDIGKIDPMYQFSLDSYIALFNMSINKSTKNPELAVRIDNINDYHTYATYRYICRGLFEKHKLLFSFHMTAKILEAAGKLNMQEFNMFLRGGQVLDRDTQIPNPHAGWINPDAWDSITEFDRNLPKFQGLAQSFEQLGRDWQRWYISASPETEQLPGEWNSACNDLQRMLVVRALRADRVGIVASNFIVNNLGARFVEPPPLNMKQVLDDSTETTPLIFVLSTGVDPTTSLIDLATAENMSQRFHSLSLGQGQAPIAERMIAEGCKHGHWVFLANCHLSLSWMPALSKIVELLEVNRPHKDFRLWLSSSPDPRFPISILQAGIKMTTEPPKGIKANMKRLYLQLTEESFGKCQAQQKYKRLMFCLTFFHSILIERRKFQMLGWNVDYPFNDSDFLVSNNLLTIFLDEYEETPWDALKYLISGINYGGHVTDDWDRRVMITYINDLFVNDVLQGDRFRVSQSDVYHVPPDGSLQSYRDYVNTLPNVDPPEAFGQNSNADISSMIRESRVLLGTLVSLQPAVSSKGGQSNEDKVLELAADMVERLPAVIDYKATAKLLQDEPHPLNVVLLQEIERYNALLVSMRRSLVDVQKGIQGLVVMSTELEEMFTCFLNGLVPGQWRTTYPSQKPLAAWMRDLIERVAFFTEWATTGRQPVIFWMSAFTFPTGFLTAVLQHAARQNAVAVDTLSWDFSVNTQEDAAIMEQPKDGVYIRGLFLEGASWDRKRGHLVDSAPMQLVSPMPTMLFRPTEKKKTLRGNYVCPCYYYPNRNGEGGAAAWSFVIAVDLKGGERTSEYWIKLGAALLMSLES